RQELVKQSKQKTDKLVELLQQEIARLEKARPSLREEIARLEAAHEEELALAEARLKPEKADEGLRAYQVKTGKQLPRPLAIPDKDRGTAIVAANDVLFDLLVQIEQVRRWERLIEGRLSPAGAPSELGAYQDRLGSLAATYGNQGRRLVALGGKVDEEPAFPINAEAPASSEIASARRDLFAVRRSGVLRLLAEVAAVVVAALLLPPLLMRLLRRVLKADDPGSPQAHARLVMTFLQAVVRLV